jgi:SlyX protein
LNNELSATELQAQIEALEVKIAYQEDTIDSLNQTVIKQADKLESLELVLKQLVDKLKTANANDQGINDGLELPPHY